MYYYVTMYVEVPIFADPCGVAALHYIAFLSDCATIDPSWRGISE
jgi:hypothetical protein